MGSRFICLCIRSSCNRTTLWRWRKGTRVLVTTALLLVDAGIAFVRRRVRRVLRRHWLDHCLVLVVWHVDHGLCPILRLNFCFLVSQFVKDDADHCDEATPSLHTHPRANAAGSKTGRSIRGHLWHFAAVQKPVAACVRLLINISTCCSTDVPQGPQR